jgi:hypothetical protein
MNEFDSLLRKLIQERVAAGDDPRGMVADLLSRAAELVRVEASLSRTVRARELTARALHFAGLSRQQGKNPRDARQALADGDEALLNILFEPLTPEELASKHQWQADEPTEACECLGCQKLRARQLRPRELTRRPLQVRPGVTDSYVLEGPPDFTAPLDPETTPDVYDYWSRHREEIENPCPGPVPINPAPTPEELAAGLMIREATITDEGILVRPIPPQGFYLSRTVISSDGRVCDCFRASFDVGRFCDCVRATHPEHPSAQRDVPPRTPAIEAPEQEEDDEA